jgi:capsular exopolysaccharide synthesis family protein
LEEERARKNIEPLERMLDTVLTQMQQNKFKGDVKGNTPVYDAKMIVEAGPGTKVAPNLMQTLIAAAFLGLLGGMGLAYVSELTDKSFRTPDEIRRRLGVRVIGHIPRIEPVKGELVAGLSPQLCAAHTPRSMNAEAFRGLRTALYFSIQGRGHQVIQVTSPHMGDGKSTLVANLAISIAQSGKSVVLIDADFRRPKIHKFFSIANPNVGLASVISGDAELVDAIQPCAVHGLFILPCGPRPTNPAELLTLPRFQDLLKVIREKYDFVLIDTPPLLVVSDPAVVAPRVDGVILTLRVAKNNRPVAERAKELLTSLGTNILGVVVNGYDDVAAGRRYGYSYHYSYGYGYNYGYPYAYSYDTTYSEDGDASQDTASPDPAPPSA